MAERLASYYAEVAKLGGLKAKMRLAMLTSIPSSNATKVPDSSDNIAKFESAMREIKKEFNWEGENYGKI